MQSNDGAFELLFSNFFGEYMAQATALADVEWASQSCALGWGVKGLWPAINDGTIYTAAARSLEGAYVLRFFLLACCFLLATGYCGNEREKG